MGSFSVGLARGEVKPKNKGFLPFWTMLSTRLYIKIFRLNQICGLSVDRIHEPGGFIRILFVVETTTITSWL